MKNSTLKEKIINNIEEELSYLVLEYKSLDLKALPFDKLTSIEQALKTINEYIE